MTILLGPEDRVIVHQCWKFPVPTAFEVKLLLESFPEEPDVELGLGFIATTGLRPVEVTRLVWNKFKIATHRVERFTHYVNKPSGRVAKGGINWQEKELQKEVCDHSQWLSAKIIAYAKIAPKFKYDKLFQWSSSDGLCKWLERLRKRILKFPDKYGPEYQCFFDTNSYVKAGPNQPIPYRINAYSLRRFAFTFYYYVVFRCDPISTAKYFGHSTAATTLGHYVMPKEAIGLTQEMINARITIDQFIHLHGKNQMRLIDYDPTWESRFVPQGQKQLADFA